ncbi:MAG TPA: YfbM family protein [Spirochaetales bacterium]|nr:YfbM family protein [Spirochaetales bacterium]
MIARYAPVSPARLAELAADDAALARFLELAEDDDALALDADKSWHGIHYLLCGSPWDGQGPFHDLAFGGESLGDEDWGYGPARVLAPEAVASIRTALDTISFTALRGRFETEVLGNREILPGFEDASDFDYLEYHFERIKAWFAKTADSGAAMLAWIS